MRKKKTLRKIEIVTLEQDAKEKIEEMARRTPAERYAHLQKLIRLSKIFSSKRSYESKNEEGIILKEK